MEEPQYPYEEFLGHFGAMKHVLKYDTVRTDYSSSGRVIKVGNDHSIEMNMGRILDYFAQLEYPRKKMMYQAPRLAHILTYLTVYLEYFDRERFVVAGAKDAPSLVKGSLLRALHQHFAKPGPPSEIAPEAITARARQIEEQEHEDSEPVA